MDPVYGFDKQGVDAIRQTVDAVLGTPINAVGSKRGHRIPQTPRVSATLYQHSWQALNWNDVKTSYSGDDFVLAFRSEGMRYRRLRLDSINESFQIRVNSSTHVGYIKVSSIIRNADSDTLGFYPVTDGWPLIHALWQEYGISDSTPGRWFSGITVTPSYGTDTGDDGLTYNLMNFAKTASFDKTVWFVLGGDSDTYIHNNPGDLNTGIEDALLVAIDTSATTYDGKSNCTKIARVIYDEPTNKINIYQYHVGVLDIGLHVLKVT